MSFLLHPYNSLVSFLCYFPSINFCCLVNIPLIIDTFCHILNSYPAPVFAIIDRTESY